MRDIALTVFLLVMATLDIMVLSGCAGLPTFAPPNHQFDPMLAPAVGNILKEG